MQAKVGIVSGAYGKQNLDCFIGMEYWRRVRGGKVSWQMFSFSTIKGVDPNVFTPTNSTDKTKSRFGNLCGFKIVITILTL